MFTMRSSISLVAFAVLFGVVQCGCYNRVSSRVAPTYAPACAPVYGPTCAPGCAPACAPYPAAYPAPYLAPAPLIAPPCVSPYYDLSQLYSITKALDCSCGNNNNNAGLNLDQLLNKLVNALVLATSEGKARQDNNEPLISLDLLRKLSGGGLGILNLGLGGTSVVDSTLGADTST